MTLSLLDVDVTDKNGRPMRGLTKQDFAVFLDGREWPIYSVDDLCPCSAEPPGKGGKDSPKSAPGVESGSFARAAGEPPAAVPEAGRQRPKAADRDARADAEALHYVLYFDFSQLQVDGRSRAIGEARRWIRETRRPGDRVLVAGYASAAGVRELCSFTDDAAVLLAAVDRAASDPLLVDPYPSFRYSRGIECDRSINDCGRLPGCELPTLTCTQFARDEYHHGRQSLQALKLFLGGLAETPGRKSLIFFEQNGTLSPAELYPYVTDHDVSDHQRLVEQVGAEATGSRTSIFSAYTGGRGPSRGGVDLLSVLAEYTGGDFNSDYTAMPRLTSRARPACSCIYRIGLEPRGKPSGRPLRARVEVRGKPVEYTYRVQFLDSTDRWLRRAVSILANPSKASAIDLAAAIVPVRASKGQWDVSVQVALDLKDLAKLPASAGTPTAWEVGALLSRADGDAYWEMLGESAVSRAGDGTTRRALLHHRELKGLSPGSYRLAAFVRDRTADLFGGAEAVIDLPPPRTPKVLGPLVMHARRFLDLPLPILKKRSSEGSSTSEIKDGPVPFNSHESAPDDALEMLTWICPASGATPPARILRFLQVGGKPFSRLDPTTPEPAGDCFRIQDRIETSLLSPGSYTYNLRWPRPDPAPPLTASASFTVGARPQPVEGDGTPSPGPPGALEPRQDP